MRLVMKPRISILGTGPLGFAVVEDVRTYLPKGESMEHGFHG
jgi:hypothetical protein